MLQFPLSGKQHYTFRYIATLTIDMPGKWIFGLIYLCLFSPECKAQRSGTSSEARFWKRAQKQYQPFSFGLRGGSTQFWGELHHRNLAWTYGGALRYNFRRSEAFSLGLEIHRGQLFGEKRTFFNSWFVNDFTSVEFIPRWDIIRGLTWDQERRLSIDLYTGVGLSLFSAEAFDLSTGELVRFTNHPQKSGRTPLFKKYGGPVTKLGVRRTHERIIPIGVAPGYQLTRELTLGIDLRFHFVRTDKMDATSGYRLINPEEADSYSNTPNDTYSTAVLFLNYRFLLKK